MGRSTLKKEKPKSSSTLHGVLECSLLVHEALQTFRPLFQLESGTNSAALRLRQHHTKSTNVASFEAPC